MFIMDRGVETQNAGVERSSQSVESNHLDARVVILDSQLCRTGPEQRHETFSSVALAVGQIEQIEDTISVVRHLLALE
jgi:hypothetical protein